MLDVAAGSGNASLPAAAAGARVVATDLTPELRADRPRAFGGTRPATSPGRRPTPSTSASRDGEFDVVLSCVGVMFAPFHQPVADELVRVVRPGGRDRADQLDAERIHRAAVRGDEAVRPPPPAGATPGPLWGDEAHVRSLFGDAVTELRAERRKLRVDRFASAAEFREFFATFYGPTIAAYRNIADDPTRIAALDKALIELADEFGAAAATWSGSTYSLSRGSVSGCWVARGGQGRRVVAPLGHGPGVPNRRLQLRPRRQARIVRERDRGSQPNSCAPHERPR